MASVDGPEMRKAVDFINRLYSDLVGSRSHRNSFIHWRIPRDWKGTRYLFGYTPWRTLFKGKKGFYAVKYRVFKKYTKLVKAVRCGTRKRARQKSLDWHKAYYKNEEKEKASTQTTNGGEL